MSVTKCLWCGRAFTSRATGGKAQRFCRPACRRAFDGAGRRWVAEALAPARAAPAERPGEAEELLGDLLAVLFGLRGDAWAAVYAAVPARFRNGSIATSGGPESQPRFPSGPR